MNQNTKALRDRIRSTLYLPQSCQTFHQPFTILPIFARFDLLSQAHLSHCCGVARRTSCIWWCRTAFVTHVMTLVASARQTCTRSSTLIAVLLIGALKSGVFHSAVLIYLQEMSMTGSHPYSNSETDSRCRGYSRPFDHDFGCLMKCIDISSPNPFHTFEKASRMPHNSVSHSPASFLFQGHSLAFSLFSFFPKLTITTIPSSNPTS